MIFFCLSSPFGGAVLKQLIDAKSSTLKRVDNTFKVFGSLFSTIKRQKQKSTLEYKKTTSDTSDQG